MSGFSPLFTAVLTAVYSGCRIPFFRLRAFRQMEIAPLLVLTAESRFSPYKVITKTLTEVSAFLVQFFKHKKEPISLVISDLKALLRGESGSNIQYPNIPPNYLYIV